MHNSFPLDLWASYVLYLLQIYGTIPTFFIYFIIYGLSSRSYPLSQGNNLFLTLIFIRRLRVTKFYSPGETAPRIHKNCFGDIHRVLVVVKSIFLGA